MERSIDSTLLYSARKRIVEDFAAQIRFCLNALHEEQIWWRPNEKANSIGNLVLHVCGSTWNYIVQAIGGENFDRDREAEFAERKEIPRAELLRRFDAMISSVEEVLSRITPEQLNTTTDRTGKETTFARIILHVLAHVATHMGQIVYITKMLEEGVVDELWIKTRS